MSHFDYINFKTLLFIKMNAFNEIKIMAHLKMLVIFHWMWLFVKFSIYHTFITSLLKKLIFLNEKFKKLITSKYLNMVQTCDMIWFNIPSTFIKIKNHIYIYIYIDYICVFEYTCTQVHYICFHNYTPISHMINEMK